MFSEAVLDHFHHPRNSGELADTSASVEIANPVCGDVLRLAVRMANGQAAEVRFKAQGCVTAIASASMLTELAKGKPLEWVKVLSKEDILKMLGTSDLGPARIKCALLSMKVLKTGVYGYLGAKLEDAPDH